MPNHMSYPLFLERQNLLFYVCNHVHRHLLEERGRTTHWSLQYFTRAFQEMESSPVRHYQRQTSLMKLRNTSFQNIILMKFLSGIECWFTLPTFVSITMSEFTSSSFQLPYSHQGSSRSSILCGPTTGAASAFVSQRQ